MVSYFLHILLYQSKHFNHEGKFDRFILFLSTYHVSVTFFKGNKYHYFGILSKLSITYINLATQTFWQFLTIYYVNRFRTVTQNVDDSVKSLLNILMTMCKFLVMLCHTNTVSSFVIVLISR